MKKGRNNKGAIATRILAAVLAGLMVLSIAGTLLFYIIK